MTGYIGALPVPLGATTVGAFADLGYAVDFDAADPFDIAAASGRASASAPDDLDLRDDILHLPLRRIDQDGNVAEE